MAKGKQRKVFLEVLQQNAKRKSGDTSTPPPTFQTPAWFGNGQPRNKNVNYAVTGPTVPRKRWPVINFSKLKPAHFAIIGVVLAGIFITAIYIKRTSPSAAPISVAGEQIQASPIQNDVTETAMTPPAGGIAPTRQALPATPAVTAPRVTPVAPPVESVNRTIGMNYVVIQSYKDEQTAREAVAALQAAGIGATVEIGHPYAPSWFVVFGTRPFARTNTPEYQQYLRDIAQVSERFAATSRWKRFEPNAYRWR